MNDLINRILFLVSLNCKKCGDINPSNRKYYCSDKCKLESKINIDLETNCWNYTGSINHLRGGYGLFIDNNQKSHRAHRFAYKLYNGHIDDDKVVRHMCHNRLCCNPNHLKEGTPQDNANDCVKAGRRTKGDNHPQSKITNDEVDKLFKLYQTGNFTISFLSKKAGISQSTLTRRFKNKLKK